MGFTSFTPDFIVNWKISSNHWIGFVGKIYTGNHGFYHEIWGVSGENFPNWNQSNDSNHPGFSTHFTPKRRLWNGPSPCAWTWEFGNPGKKRAAHGMSNPWRIHGAGRLMLTWLGLILMINDPWSTIYSSTMDPSWDIYIYICIYIYGVWKTWYCSTKGW